MWVLLWAKINCASGLSGDREERYVWCSEESAKSDEKLKNYALDFMESISWMQGAERVKYGFERLPDGLPEEVGRKMIKDLQTTISFSKREIAFIRKHLPRGKKAPRTRFQKVVGRVEKA